ncbi:MAG: LLM class flavin-dependent oxidoreductase [Dehalococcoidia bacterium]
MAKKARFGTGMGRHQTTLDIGEHAAAAEKYGFEHVTILDDITLTRDVYVLLSVAAMSTSRILLGQGVTHPYIRHPVQTATATASINELSKGRAFLGIGAGALYGLIGHHNGTAKDLREAVLIARGLSRGEEVELSNGTKIHSPWMKDPFPIYVGSDGPYSMMLAAELADATWVPNFDPTIARWRMEMFERGLEKAKRRREDFDIWLRTMVVLADSKEEGRDIARPYAATIAHQFAMAILLRDNQYTRALKSQLPQSLLDDYQRAWDAWDDYQHETFGAKHAEVVSDQIVDQTMIIGTPEQVAEQINEILDIGYDGISMTVYLHRDPIKFWRDFHDHVTPLVEG